jgi:hypothetical protein
MRFNGVILGSLDGYDEKDDGSCWDDFCICIRAKNRKELEKIKEDMECVIELRPKKVKLLEAVSFKNKA